MTSSPPAGDVRREVDLTGIYFENVNYPLSRDTWYSWLSTGGFYDPSPEVEYSLDLARTEEPRYYVIDKKSKRDKTPLMKIYILDGVCYQAPPVQRVVLCRVNNAAGYLDEAFTMLVEKRRRIEDIEKEKEKDDTLVDPVLASTLHAILMSDD